MHENAHNRFTAVLKHIVPLFLCLGEGMIFKALHNESKTNCRVADIYH